MFKFNCFIIFSIAVIGCYSCDPEVPEPVDVPDTIDSLDLGIAYSLYLPDSIYTTDTLQFQFKVTNYGPSALAAGDQLLVACELNHIIYAFDLLGPGPTKLTLGSDIAVGESFYYDAGYLLGNPTLDYFGVDNIDIGLIVYGINDMIADTTFPNDTYTENNKAIINFDGTSIKLK